jgi:metal-responsive CopG/Arc/MetJ family transcriptional regulator
MVLKKRTYGLPADAVESFEKEVPPGDRSAVVADLIRHWLAEKRRRKLREAVAEGCREMAELYLEIEKEYHPLEEEIHRVLEDQPKTRRRGSRPTRSRRRI